MTYAFGLGRVVLASLVSNGINFTKPIDVASPPYLLALTGFGVA
jgi:hypothetical protein